MNRIESQVRRARQRLILGRFGRGLCIAMFAALIIATIAVAFPAMRVIDVDASIWAKAWIGGSVAIAIVVAGFYAWLTAPSLSSVATEVDRRFSLQERLSSSLTLNETDRYSDFGTALVADAEKRADDLAIADKFALKPSKLGWLPISLVPILAIVVLLVEPAQPSTAKSTSVDPTEVKQVQTVASQLKKRIQQQRRKAEAEGLKEAEELFQKMESDLDKIANKENLDRKQALIAMNDLKKKLEERREQLGSKDEMRRVMSQMNGLSEGPGEKVAKAIEKGNFGDAQKLATNLADKIRDGKLSDAEKEQLKKQVEEMKKQLQQAAEQHEQQKKELEQKIEQAQRDGRKDDAAQMQQQLNQMRQKDGQMQQMKQMAEAMNQAQQAMQQGDPSAAADALQQMADQLGDMQSEMSELEDLQSAMDQLSQSKEQMRCQQCGGAGCQQCQGNGFGRGQKPGNGLGAGQGEGERPEDETDTNTYETQVRGQVRKGKAIIAGFADGPNRKGISREEVKQSIEAALSEESDPLENQTLPRTEREHAQQYFDRLREG